MKKSLIALVVLGAFASAASAQSSVTIYGKLDQGFGKAIGSSDKVIKEAANSRLGFRGTEDLGGGLSAIFTIEHRFTPDDGKAHTTFWHGQSLVGLSSKTLGTVTIGRQYTSAFDVQNAVDPFGGDGVAALRPYGMATGNAVAQTRVADSVKYKNSFAGFSVSGDIAEHVATVAGDDRPYSVSFTYGAGPIWAGVSFENASGDEDRLINAGVRYTFGPVTLSAGGSEGRTNAATNNKLRGYLVGANVVVGAGEIKAGWTSLKVSGVTTNTRYAVGYHHNLSKRTKLYADVARETKVITTQKTGYEIGVQHNF